MKNYNDFLNNKSYEIELNEGLFDMFKKLFGKINQYITNTKGGKEVQKIFDKYVDIINKEFTKLGFTDLNISNSNTLSENTAYISKYDVFINEAIVRTPETPETPGVSDDEMEKNKKMSIQKLKQKSDVLNKIIETYKAKALKEMDNVLKKYGGSDKNPKLAIIINNKKDEFNLKFLNSKIKYLENAGDKIEINKIKIERDKLSKQLNDQWKSFDKAGEVGGQLVSNSFYRYKSSSGIKTIQYLRPSQTSGKCYAKYLINEDGITDREQQFTTANIDLDYKALNLEAGQEYNYYDDEEKVVIKVKIVSYNDSDNTIKLESDGNSFDGHIGCLRDKVVAPEQTTETTT